MDGWLGNYINVINPYVKAITKVLEQANAMPSSPGLNPKAMQY